jgi:hypothetical protein
MGLQSGAVRKARAALSGGGATVSPLASRFTVLARLSLLLGCMTLPTACLVDDPPAYVAPKQTRPFFDYRHAYPLLSEIIQAKAGDKIPFSVPVVSEDAGDQLYAIMVEEWVGGHNDGGRGHSAPASTLDDTSRAFSFDWTVATAVPGCRRFTLRATHNANLNFLTFPPEIIDPADTAEAYWWGNVDVDPSNANKLNDCPSDDRGSP